jgi:thiol-disulfide isomerase/thioredoxin
MKSFPAAAGLCLALFLSLAPARAADPPAPAAAKASIQTQLDALVDRFNAKIEAGKTTATDLASELQQLDALLAEHKAEQSEAAADILALKVNIYDQVLGDPEAAIALVRQFKVDFPGTKRAREADDKIKALADEAAARKIAQTLKVGTAFPAFSEVDMTGQPLSLAGLKGKVVLIDFWATWCEPCVVELPNLTALYKKYHDGGFAIVGVSLDHAADKGALTAFIKDKGMPWPEFFDGKDQGNKLAVQYGVQELPCSYLLDGTGKIIGKNLRGEKLEQAVAAALPGAGKN